MGEARMFGRKVFGKKPSIEEPKRPETPPQGQIFNKELFDGEMGEFLRKHGYFPDDPRNQAPNVQPVSVLLAEDQAGMRRATEALIFLPGDERGAAALGLPVAPPEDEDPLQYDTARAILSCIHDQYIGNSAPDVEATAMLLRDVRSNFPVLFPPDTADFSDRVREARAQVRVYAFLHATNSKRISKETIVKSQATFLGEPKVQLIA
jgi:hypothetical protein